LSYISSISILLLPQTEEEVHVFARVCLSVWSVSKITQKRVHGMDEMLRVDRCRDMDELINF